MKIAGATYRLRYFTRKEARSISDRWGDCHSDDKLIRMHPNLKGKPETFLNTMIHEILHAVWDQMAIADHNDEERDVTCVANGIAGVILDNPKLGPWIVAMSEIARKL